MHGAEAGPERPRALKLLKELLEPLGSNSALSPRVALIVIPLALVAQVHTLRAENGGELALWLVAAAIGYAVLVGGFALARRLFSSRDPGVLVVLGIFILLATVRALTVELASVAMGLVTDVDIQLVVMSGLVTGPALLSVVAFPVSRYDAHQAIVADLASKRDVLLETQRNMDAELARTTSELASAVRSSLDPAIQALDSSLREAVDGESTQPVVSALAHLIDEQVRPLSHRLAADHGFSILSRVRDAAAATREVRVPLPARFRIADGIDPFVAGLMGGLVALAPAFLNLPTAAAVAYTLGVALSAYVLLALARRVLRGVELPTAAAMLAAVLLHVVLTRPFVLAVDWEGGRIPPGARGAGPSIWALIGAGVFMNALVDARRAPTEEELAAVTDRLAIELGIARRRVGLTQRRLARILHGDLQGALYAAAMRLSAAPAMSTDLVESVRDDIEVALGKLDIARDLGSGTNLKQTLAEILGTWSDQRSITWCVSAEAEAALARDPDADEAAAVVVQEAITNALRHGKARTVYVSVELGGDECDAVDTISVRVTDDGLGWAAGSKPGLGSVLFEELCYSWGYTSDEAGTTFRSVLTLDLRAASAQGSTA